MKIAEVGLNKLGNRIEKLYWRKRVKRVVVEDYNPEWETRFEELRRQLWHVVSEFSHSIEHVGSTSVPRLAAKPIIDIDIIVDPGDVELATQRLETLGYIHRGNLGVEGREAYGNPPNAIAHHLYVCEVDSLALKNHLVVREQLRSAKNLARTYGSLKKELAAKFPNDNP